MRPSLGGSQRRGGGGIVEKRQTTFMTPQESAKQGSRGLQLVWAKGGRKPTKRKSRNRTPAERSRGGRISYLTQRESAIENLEKKKWRKLRHLPEKKKRRKGLVSTPHGRSVELVEKEEKGSLSWQRFLVMDQWKGSTPQRVEKRST